MIRRKRKHAAMTRRYSGKSFSAFTLIELLVVISIVSLLIAILLPALRKARDSARSAMCLTNMRQMGIATSIYYNDWNGWYPRAGRDSNNPLDHLAMTMGIMGYDHVVPHLPSVAEAPTTVQTSDVYYTKPGGGMAMNFQGLPTTVKETSIFRCPMQPEVGSPYEVIQRSNFGQYGYNQHLGSYRIVEQIKPSAYRSPHSLTSVMICGGGVNPYKNRLFYHDANNINRRDFAWPYHDDKSMILLLDGHAGYLDLYPDLPVHSGYPGFYIFDKKYAVDPINPLDRTW